MVSIRRALSRVSTTRQSLLAAASAATLALVYFWKLGNITPGMSPKEAQTLAASQSLHGFSGHILNAPHNFWLYLEIHFKHADLTSERAVSVLIALIIIGCVYYLMRVWFGRLVGYIATMILALTPLAILAGRSLRGDIMILLPLVLSACYFWVIRSKYSSWRVALLAFLAILCLYVPGGAWLVLFGAVYAHLALAGLHKRTPKMVKVAIYLMMLVSIAPLVYALARHPAQLHGLFLIPTSFPGIVEVLKNVAWMAAGLVWHTGSSSDYQIGQLGLLSLTQFTLAAFGLYAMWARARAKSYAFLGLIIFGVLAAGLNNIYPLLLISLIGVSVFVAAGLRFLLLEWQTVFPRNPLPRGLAIVLFCSLMAMQAVYGIRYSLVAWPHTDQVRQTYVIK